MVLGKKKAAPAKKAPGNKKATTTPIRRMKGTGRIGCSFRRRVPTPNWGYATRTTTLRSRLTRSTTRKTCPRRIFRSLTSSRRDSVPGSILVNGVPRPSPRYGRLSYSISPALRVNCPSCSGLWWPWTHQGVPGRKTRAPMKSALWCVASGRMGGATCWKTYQAGLGLMIGDG